jgi:anti-sigma factor (TIGR02949 family)
MECQEIFEGLSEYVDDELAEETCREIRKHLEGCSNCRVVVNTLKRTVSLYHTFPKEEVPGDVRTRLHKTIRLAREESD